MRLVHPNLVGFLHTLQKIAQGATDQDLFRATDNEALRSALDNLVVDVQCACGMEPTNRKDAVVWSATGIPPADTGEREEDAS